MSSALSLLREAEDAGLRVWVKDGRLRVSSDDPPFAELLARLRASKNEVRAILTGDRCRHCGEPINWKKPGGVAFADFTGAHEACFERSKP